MTFQPNQNLYGVAIGTTDGNDPGYPHYDSRAPATTDILYPLGKIWVFKGTSAFILLGFTSAGGITSATWAQIT